MGEELKPPAEGEVAKLVRLIEEYALTWERDVCLLGNMTAGQLARAAVLLQRLAAAAPQAAGEEPTREELIQLAIDTRLHRFQATAGDPVQYEMTEQQLHAFADAILARWGRPALRPVPVSERLPEAEDCDAEGRCWMFTTAVDPGWVLDYPWHCTGWTHWLPAHALPVPEVTE